MAGAESQEISAAHGRHCSNQYEGHRIQVPVQSSKYEHSPRRWSECWQEIDAEHDSEERKIRHAVIL